jgi:MFS family permease
MTYIRLLQRNPNFARLWYAQAISLLGDWFNTIILSALVARYSENAGLAVSILLLTRFLPPLMVSPVAGVLLDRFDRRRLLILSDVARIFIVLGYLFATSPDHIWLIYVLSALQFSFSALFEPGRSALLPGLVKPDDLVRANLLSSVTWSVMLAVGGALGGFVSAVLGSQIGLLLDAATFVVSAALIASIRINPALAALNTANTGEAPGKAGFVEGLRYARRQPGLIPALLVKAAGSIGNMDVAIVLYGTLLFAIGDDGSASLGLLWSAFGVGAVLGPVLINRLNDGRVRRMRSLIIVGYGFIALGWFALAGAPALVLAMLAITVRAMGGSINWTYSSVIIQKTVANDYLGRMFSLDQAAFQAMTVVSIIVTGLALQALGDEAVREIVAFTGVLALLPLMGWAVTVRWLRRTPETTEAGHA